MTISPRNISPYCISENTFHRVTFSWVTFPRIIYCRESHFLESHFTESHFPKLHFPESHFPESHFFADHFPVYPFPENTSQMCFRGNVIRWDGPRGNVPRGNGPRGNGPRGNKNTESHTILNKIFLNSSNLCWDTKSVQWWTYGIHIGLMEYCGLYIKHILCDMDMFKVHRMVHSLGENNINMAWKRISLFVFSFSEMSKEVLTRTYHENTGISLTRCWYRRERLPLAWYFLSSNLSISFQSTHTWDPFKCHLVVWLSISSSFSSFIHWCCLLLDVVSGWCTHTENKTLF
jgi:hypothetical protein